MDDLQNPSLCNSYEEERVDDAEDVAGGNIITDDIREEKLRRKLKFFFMNPVEKWNYKQRFPYKLLVQLFKVIIVTIQLCLFAQHRAFYIDYIFNNKIVFSHLFVENWDPAREITTYPPQTGVLGAYKTAEFFSLIDFAVKNYANLDEAIGDYSYTEEDNSMAPGQFCFRHFKQCRIFGFNESYSINSKVLKTCIDINITKNEAQNFSAEEFFQENNILIDFSSFLDGSLSFGIKTVNLNSAGPMAPPDCFRFNVSLIFDYKIHDGRIKIFLDLETFRLHCNGNTDFEGNASLESLIHSIVNCFVIVACLLSGYLCIRSVYRAQCLRRKTVQFFNERYNKEVSFKGQCEFLSLWYVTMIISDFVIIIGSALKEKIEKNEFSGDEWNTCSVILGVGNFLIWFCILRYLCFFKTYNVIILTLKVAAPSLFRFMVCVCLIYAGFTFCGWLVLGPYHMKFRTLSGTSECLFALINGDDVFGTFSTLEPTKSKLIWWFCRFYLYVFISLFIYVVLSLFVSVILDAYEAIKNHERGFPKTDIQEFIEGSLERNLWSDSSSSSLADEFDKCWRFCKLKKRVKKSCCFADSSKQSSCLINET